eukprot:scaffold23392_cov41-Attheya_sp.AAC.1
MEYNLARARNIDAAPVEMYWSARTRSFLPRPVQVHGTAFSPYVAYLGPTVASTPTAGALFRATVH